MSQAIEVRNGLYFSKERREGKRGRLIVNKSYSIGPEDEPRIFYLPMCNCPNLFARGWSSGSLSAGRFFRGIELPCQFVAPLTHASQPIDRSFLNITNRRKTKDEERKSTRIILLYLAEQPQKRSVAE